MKRFSCPHCGHALHWKSDELKPLSLSRKCPSCGGGFAYGLRWGVFLLLFVPLVLLAIYLRQWMGSWASLPGVLLIIYFSFSLVKAQDEEGAKPEAENKTEPPAAAADEH